MPSHSTPNAATKGPLCFSIYMYTLPPSTFYLMHPCDSSLLQGQCNAPLEMELTEFSVHLYAHRLWASLWALFVHYILCKNLHLPSSCINCYNNLDHREMADGHLVAKLSISKLKRNIKFLLPSIYQPLIKPSLVITLLFYAKKRYSELNLMSAGEKSPDCWH